MARLLIRVDIVGLIILINLWSCKMISPTQNVRVNLNSLTLEEPLEPTRLKFTKEYIYLDNITTRLIEIDKLGNYTPKLAKEIIASEDKKELTFKLHDDYFSDGTKITAKDVVQSFKRAIISGLPHSNPKEYILGADKLTSLNDDIVGIKLIDNKTLKLTLKQPVKEIYYYLQLTDFAIYHPTQINKKELSVADWTVSSGPYSLQKNSEGKVIFVKNTHSRLHVENSPEIIEPVKVNGSVNDLFIEQTVDFGELSVVEMENFIKSKSTLNYRVFGNQNASIAFLTLNSDKGIFKNKENRKILQAKLFKNVKYKNFSSELVNKTYQYFLPGARGYVEGNILEKNLDQIYKYADKDLPAFSLKSTKGIYPYMPNNFIEELRNESKVKFEIDFNNNGDDYRKWLEQREFDAIFMVASMSYKVLAESLNLIYNSNPNEVSDPTGIVKELLKEYQESFNQSKDEKIIKKILLQMTEDAEIIPLAYFPVGKFYNKEKLDISELYLEESMQFWRLKVK